MSENIFLQLLDTLKFVLPSVLLPILILWITRRTTLKNRRDEQAFELEKIKESKQLGVDLFFEKMRNDHEVALHARLIKILHEIQKLRVTLTGKIDGRKLSRNITSFQKSLKLYQDEIAEFQFYLSPKITNQLYAFYGGVNELVIELQKIKDLKEYELAEVAVYKHYQELAELVLKIQKTTIGIKGYSKVDIGAIRNISFLKSSVGTPPPSDMFSQYEQTFQKDTPQKVKGELVEIPQKENIAANIISSSKKFKIKKIRKAAISLIDDLVDQPLNHSNRKLIIKEVRRARAT